MDIGSNLITGFQQVLHPINLLYCFVGVFLGTLIGVLPGIGPMATISMLLPLSLGTPLLAGIIMLAGVYYGAMYGGSTTSILVNIPGEVASVVTCIDGYQMARRGRAGPALGISAFGSFIGGTFSILMLMLLAIPLSKLAASLGPSEYFALITMGITMVIYLSSRSFLKGLIMALVGLILGCVGTDLVSGKTRFAYGIFPLYDGIDIAPMCMGLFGISEILKNIGKLDTKITIFEGKVKNILPNLQDWKKSALPISRGTILGFLLGLIPGGGGVLASFISYAVEKRFSKHAEEFGKGAIEGVAGPETANNAAVGSSFIPLFALGIPTNIVIALLLASFMMHGVAPGPFFMARNPEIFWGIVCSMYLGNIMLLILNLPLIAIWIKLLEVPYRILFPLLLLFCMIGAYTINGRIFDILVMVAFGITGFFLKEFDYEPAPLALAFVLGPLLEMSFKQSLILGSHNLYFFFSRPVTFGAIFISILLLISSVVAHWRKFRKGLLEKGLED